MMDDGRVGIVSRALHTFHGRGYCSMGQHTMGQNFLCYDEARAVLAALDGADPGHYVEVEPALTLADRKRAITERAVVRREVRPVSKRAVK